MAENEVQIRFRADASELARAGQQIASTGNQVEQELAKAEKASGNFLSRVYGQFTQLGFAIFGVQQTIQGLGMVFSNVFNQNIQFEKFTTQFKVILGSADAAKARIAELSEFARSTPFELPQVVQASLILEKFTKGALSTGDGLRMVGDVAAGVGAPINELAMWFGRLYDGIQSGRPVGEAVMRLQELGAISGETRNKIEQMQQAGVEGSVIWAALTEDLGQYKGMMEELSKTGEGSISNIVDAIGILKRNLMGGLYDSAFKPAAQFLAGFLGDPKLQEGARNLGNAIGTGLAKGVSAFGEAVGAVMGPVIDFGVELTGKIKEGVQWLLDNVPSLTEKLREHGSEYKGLAVAFGPAGVAALAVANNWDTLSGKIKEFTGIDVEKKIDGVKGAFSDFFSGFKVEKFDELERGLDRVNGTAEIGGKSVREWGFLAKEALGEIGKGANNALQEVSRFGEGAADALSGFFSGLVSGEGSAADTMIFGKSASEWGAEARKAFDDALAGLTPFKDALLELGSGAALSLDNFLQGDWKGGFEELKASAKGFVDELTKSSAAKAAIDELKGAWESLKPVIEGVKAILGPLVDNIAKNFKESLGPTVDAIKRDLLPALESLKPAFESIASAALPVLEMLGKILGVVIVGAIAILLVAVNELIKVLGTILPPVITAISVGIEAAGAVIKLVADVVKGLARIFNDTFDMIAALISGDWKRAWEEFKNVVFGVVDLVWTFLKNSLGILKSTFLEWIPTLFGVAFDLFMGIPKAFQGVWDDYVSPFLGGLLGRMKDAFVGAATALWDIGWNIIQGLWDGIKARWEDLKNWFTGAVDGLVGGAKKILGIGSPSKVFIEIGKAVVAGFEIGLSGLENVVGDKLKKAAESLKNFTGSELAAWREALKLGLETGVSLTQDSISKLFETLYNAISNSKLDAEGKRIAQEFVTALVAEFGRSGSLANQAVIDLIDKLLSGAADAVKSLPHSPPQSSAPVPGSAIGTGGTYESSLNIIRNSTFPGPNGQPIIATDVTGLLNIVRNTTDLGIINYLKPEEMAAIAAQYARFGPGYRDANPVINIIIDTVNARSVGEAAQTSANLGHTVATAVAASGY